MAEKSFTTVLSRIEIGEIDGAYLFHGENYYENFLLVEKIIRAKLQSGERAYNRRSLAGERLSPQQIEESFYSVPLLGGNIVVTIGNIQRLPEKSQDFLLRALKQLDPSVTFIGSAKKLDLRRKFPKELKALCTSVKLAELRNDQLPDYIISRLQSRGLTMDQRSALEFARQVGRDPGDIENEAEKISIRFASEKNISYEQLRDYLAQSRDFNQFEVAGYLAHRQLALSLQAINTFLESSGSGGAGSLFWALYQLFERIIAYEKFSPMLSSQALAGKLRMNPFFLKELRVQADKFGGSNAVAALLAVYRAECADRFSLQSRRQIFERLVLELLV